MKRNNKALYEKIMRNISKEVKRALNESNELNITLNDVENKIKAAADGIYIAYHDHLNMDAWDVYVVRNHEFDKEHYVMKDDSEYYKTIGALNGVKQLREENPDLPVYYCNLRWSTFQDSYNIYEPGLLRIYVRDFNADGVYNLL